MKAEDFTMPTEDTLRYAAARIHEARMSLNRSDLGLDDQTADLVRVGLNSGWSALLVLARVQRERDHEERAASELLAARKAERDRRKGQADNA